MGITSPGFNSKEQGGLPKVGLIVQAENRGSLEDKYRRFL
jgi:hypothetical protein